MFEVKRQALSLLHRNNRNFATLTRLKNIRTLAGFERKSDEILIKKDTEIIIRGNKILAVGAEQITEEILSKNKFVDHDLNGALVTPAFVDPHTHIFPPEDRSGEFTQRTYRTYKEIAAGGGGILASVQACREGSEESIYLRNAKNVERFIRQGTMTLEMKSGYGLDTETELKLLRVINKLKKEFKRYIEIIPTFLGAHDVPAEYRGNTDGYVDLICNEMIPEVSKQKLAEFCDVFCENGYFNFEDSKRILKCAKQHGLKIRLHADEFEDSRAATLATKLNAYSADHLMEVSQFGIDCLGKHIKTIATILPGTTVFLGKKKFAPARELVDKGARVAIATDYNPGSCMFNSQALMMTFGMQYGRLTLEEAFSAVTRNAAISVSRHKVGTLNPGSQADLLAWDLDSLDQIPYYNTESALHITHFIKKGRVYNAKIQNFRLNKLRERNYINLSRKK